MLKALFKSQRGFTLIELLAVMAIVATLAGIVATQVSGSGQTSRDVQTKQDASTVESTVADFFSDQEGAEILISSSATVLDEESISIATSSQWPEIPITFAYPQVFQPTRSQIAAISFFSEEGTPSVLSVRGLFENYNAVDFFALEDGGYLTALPDGVSNTTKPGFAGFGLNKVRRVELLDRFMTPDLTSVAHQTASYPYDVAAETEVVGQVLDPHSHFGTAQEWNALLPDEYSWSVPSAFGTSHNAQPAAPVDRRPADQWVGTERLQSGLPRSN